MEYNLTRSSYWQVVINSRNNQRSYAKQKKTLSTTTQDREGHYEILEYNITSISITQYIWRIPTKKYIINKQFGF